MHKEIIQTISENFGNCKMDDKEKIDFATELISHYQFEQHK